MSGCIALPKHERLQHGPDLLISPMFTKDIRGVHRSRDVVETQHAASNGLSHIVVRKGIVPLV
jgi:hypothetical protein